MLPFTLLLVEDDRAEQDRVERNLRRALPDCECVRASDSVAAVNQFRRYRPEVVLLDLSLNTAGPEQGYHLLSQFNRIDSTARIIVLTGHTDPDVGIRAITLGAASFVTKPANMLALESLVRDYAQTAKFRRQSFEQPQAETIEGFIGTSATMQRVYQLIRQCAKTDSNVFIVGETGTGKEMTAQAIHRLSKRKNGPFSVYFGSVPSSLADAELFGYVRGAFTGASTKGADGCIKRADHGTLFIDELDSLELLVQRKLLRALEERMFKAIGADEYSRSDFRLLSAAHPRIFDFVRDGRFRDDLLSRVEVISISLPPLRDRREDIPLLLEHFCETVRREFDSTGSPCRIHGFSRLAVDACRQYSWPRNVRQLAHIVRHGFLHAQLRGGEQVEADDIASRLKEGDSQDATPTVEQYPQRGLTLRESLEQFERRLLADSLQRNDNTIATVCQELGVGRTTLWRKLKQYRLAGS
jgi:DNA-binding NtrC family response regulator